MPDDWKNCAACRTEGRIRDASGRVADGLLYGIGQPCVEALAVRLRSCGGRAV